MTKKSTSSLIIDKFGLHLYQKSLKFPKNKLNIFYVQEDPLMIRSIILDNDREYHLIVDEQNAEIFHDCPLFLIHSDREKKICVHLIKLLSIVNFQHSAKILGDLEKYNLTSDDFGSKKKGKNFQLLANNCIMNNNCVEALNYLNKAVNSQFDIETIIENFLAIAIDNNLFIEFFEFLSHGYENELYKYFLKFDESINRGFKKFLNVIHEYSFFNILKIIELLDTILKFKDVLFVSSLFNKFKKLVRSVNLNERYFSIYLIKKHYDKLIKNNPDFSRIITEDQLISLRGELIDYFLSEIDSFCLIDKLKLLKRQFKTLEIPKDKYYRNYKNYKIEIKHLEKKLYLKKFAFLKLLLEKYNVKQTIGEFRKKRNAYIVKHDEENLKNPVYNYIISRIGFFGLNDQTIKSSEIGFNYFIMKELFLDNLGAFQDVNYYKTQFWGEDEHIINTIEGFSLLTKNVEYTFEDEQKYSDDVIIIEWDLASKPIQGSIVNAYGSQIIIPDQNNSLFHDLKPFDLCYCKKTPVKIESSIIKIVNVITKCSFKDAIKSIYNGMTFIEGYYPLSLVKAVLKKEINPFQANELVTTNPDKLFIPNYNKFVQAFREFLLDFIFNEKDYIFEELKSGFIGNFEQILILLNLTNEMSGLDLPYPEILEKTLSSEINLNEFKSEFLNRTHLFIKEVLNKRELGSTKIFDLKRLRNTQFFKYADKILKIRKEEFEVTKIIRSNDDSGTRYDISEIIKTYYGQKFSEILRLGELFFLKHDKFSNFLNFALKLDLNLNIIDS
ncbi:MAG: hypothetical protein ACFE8B_08600 [Candidatus Hermodarchaeota archaeon]